MRTYEKYKNSGISWIGKVPNGWERIRIKYGLRQSIAGVWGEEKKNDENDVVCYRMADFNYDKGVLNLDNVTYRNILPQQLSGRTVRKGDLILEKSGGGDLYPVGRVVRVNSDQKATCSNFAHTIATNSNISSNFLYYYFFNLYSKGVSRLFFNQTTGIQNLKVGDYLSQDMYAPCKSEQEAIANYLDKKTAEIDKIIAEREKKIELLNELKSSIISRAVTKGINPHAKMKDSGIDWIGEIPEGWDIAQLKRFLSSPMKYGANEAPSSDSRDWPRYIRITDIDEDGKLRNETFKSLEPKKAKEYILKKGDLLFARSGATVGKTYIFNEDYPSCYAGYLIKAECNKKLLPEYLYYYTKSNAYINWKNSVFIQATIQNIGADKYSIMPIVIPNLREQTSILEYINDNINGINIQIKDILSEISLLREYKQSLISEVVTGKRKVID